MNPPARELVLKAFGDSGCYAYLVGCAETRQALLVDPKAGMRAVYDQALADLGLAAVAVLDTHTHADHLSDSAAWIARGSRLYMSDATTVARPLARLRDRDAVEIGRLRFAALAVPGHTPDSVALHGHGLVLSGDTLLAGGLARADFRGSRPAALFDGVMHKLMALPDPTVVLPGHGYQDILFTTIGHERAHNRALAHADGGAYARALGAVEGRGNTPEVDATLATNLAADPQLPDQPAAVAARCSVGSAPVGRGGVREQSCEELAPRRTDLVRQGRWIDVRDPWELATDGAIPGVPNLPLSELGFHLEELRRLQPEVFSCRGGVRSVTAAKTLAYLGVVDDPVSMAGGFRRWKQLGLPLKAPGTP